ncbi:alcohol dehydrogenase catalytic domain-containing protein [Streptomyces griseofuscus]|uniref:alcohol dehydrogenase catalytic domain-containing protein n=1 Tax=Streptomyces griseofuscus TaxID=146922 RepID=UPI0037F3EB59
MPVHRAPPARGAVAPRPRRPPGPPDRRRGQLQGHLRTRGRAALRAPLVPGGEGADTVLAIGADVTGFRPGDRVAWCAAPGSYVELVALPPVPRSASPTTSRTPASPRACSRA